MNSANVGHESFTSARQRLVVLTFATIEAADAWDRAGQPVDDLAAWELEK